MRDISPALTELTKGKSLQADMRKWWCRQGRGWSGSGCWTVSSPGHQKAVNTGLWARAQDGRQGRVVHSIMTQWVKNKRKPLGTGWGCIVSGTRSWCSARLVAWYRGTQLPVWQSLGTWLWIPVPCTVLRSVLETLQWKARLKGLIGNIYCRILECECGLIEYKRGVISDHVFKKLVMLFFNHVYMAEQLHDLGTLSQISLEHVALPFTFTEILSGCLMASSF